MEEVLVFYLSIAFGSIAVLVFLLLCARISVYIEDTCPTRSCLKRQQRKMRKEALRRMLGTDEPESCDKDPDRPPPPTDENITAEIICQPYIYGDEYVSRRDWKTYGA